MRMSRNLLVIAKLVLFLEKYFCLQIWWYFANYRHACGEFDTGGYDYVVLSVCEFAYNNEVSCNMFLYLTKLLCIYSSL